MSSIVKWLQFLKIINVLVIKSQKKEMMFFFCFPHLLKVFLVAKKKKMQRCSKCAHAKTNPVKIQNEKQKKANLAKIKAIANEKELSERIQYSRCVFFIFI